MPLNLVELRNFTGGLNLRADVFNLGPDETSDLLNVEIDPRGGFFSRGGIKQINTTAISGTWTPQRLTSYSPSTHYVMLSTKTKAYKSTGGDFTELLVGGGTSITISSPFGVWFSEWASDLYMSTGKTSLCTKWTGTGNANTLTASGSSQWQNDYASPIGTHMPKSNFCLNHNDKMFVANTNEDGVSLPNRIRWSHTFSPESWAEADWIDVDGGGPEILGIVSIKGHILVFKQNAIYAIYGYSKETFQLVLVSENIGLLNPNCFAKSENGIYFFDYPNGMFFYDGTKLQDRFESLRPMILNNSINPAYLNTISLSWVGRRVWLSVPYDPSLIATKPTVSFVYDPSVGKNGAWTKFSSADGYGFVGGTNWSNSTQNNLPLICHSNIPYVCSVDNYDIAYDTFAGSNSYYKMFYLTRWFDGGNIASLKMWKRPTLVCSSPTFESQLDIEVYKDFNSGSPKITFSLLMASLSSGLIWHSSAIEPDAYNGWNQATWAQGSAASLLLKGRNLGLSNSVQLKVSGPNGIKWSVNSILFKFIPRPIRT